MKFKKASDGHFYLQGPPFPGGPLVTYQLKEKALLQLQKLGITEDSRVPPDFIDRLRSEGLIFTGGSGVGEPTSTLSSANWNLNPLILWAERGSISKLAVALEQAQVTLSELITNPFLTWLCHVVGGINLSDLEDLSFSDFARFVSNSKTKHLGSIHQTLIGMTGGERVLWHLSKVLGHTLGYLKSAGEAPASWTGSIYEVIASILTSLEEYEDYEPKRRVLPHFRLPEVYWFPSQQEVKAVLPKQTLCRAGHVTWELLCGSGREELKRPSLGRTQDGDTLIPESYSAPLPPPPWEISVEHHSDNGEHSTHSRKFALTADQCVLFHESGRIVTEFCPESLLPLGQYLLLMPPAQHLEPLSGVTVIENFEAEPVLWWDWTGFSIEVTQNTALGPYEFAESPTSISWSLEDPSPTAVEFLCPLPVWLERWPEIEVVTSHSLLLEDAFLELTNVHDNSLTSIPVTKSLVSDSIAQGDETVHILDCAADLFSTFGSCHLRMRLLLSHLVENLSLPPLEFISLCAARCGYCKDPTDPETATAVVVSGASSITPKEGCTTNKGNSDREWIISADDPITEPLASFVLQTEDGGFPIELDVRLKVARAALRTDSDKFGKWQHLPVELDLSNVDLNSELRVELLEPPALDKGELVCQASNTPVVAGHPMDDGTTFLIPLHRWRDTLGVELSGEVKVHCSQTWLPVARLQGRPSTQRADLVPAETSHDSCFAPLSALESKAAKGNKEEVLSEIPSVTKHLVRSEIPYWVKDLALFRAARISAFWGDLGSTQLALQEMNNCFNHIGTFLSLRKHSSEGVTLLSVQQEIETWHETPERTLALAEISYLLSRTSPGGKGALRACRRYLSQFASPFCMDRIEAAILKAVAVFLLGEQLHETEGLSRCVQHIGVAVQYLHTPLPQWTTKGGMEKCEWPSLLKKEDCNYLDLVLRQASGHADSRHLELLNTSEVLFPREKLVLARHAKLQGQVVKARLRYQEILELKLDGYDVALDEIP